MRTRRRRPAVTWLPTEGYDSTVTGQATPSITQRFINLAGNIGEHRCVVWSPFADLQAENFGTNLPGDTALALTGEYFLRRIVGKAFVALTYGTNGPTHAVAALGFFIARVSGDGTGAVQQTTYDVTYDYSPLAQQNMREPWIWRRTWLLEQLPGIAVADTIYPASNVSYGSVVDGPHIDQKTKRRVANDERLFASFAAVSLSASGTGVETSSLGCTLDLRAVVSLRKAHNRGTF